MLDNFRLSLLTFPQRFADGELSVHVLLVPQIGSQWNGDPLQDLPLDFPAPGDTGPPFAEVELELEARILSGLDVFPRHAPVDVTVDLGPPAASPLGVPLFTELADRFQIKPGMPAAGDQAESPQPHLSIRKYLPRSYRKAFHFTGPRVPEAVIDDSYHCAIKADKQKNPAFVASTDEVTWGKVYAYCLRHQLLARQLGLIREVRFAVDPAALADGGFVYLTLGPDSEYLANLGPDQHFHFIRHYAARLPPLEAGASRVLFAPVLFPVLFNAPGPDGNYDQVFIEAAEYDDGFAKIVHTSQPVSQNLLAEEEDGFPPVNDVGARCCWDDEQLVIWQNRQLKEQEEQPGSGKRLDAPMGVFGYRVDARLQGQAAWNSLVRVAAKAPLELGGTEVGAFEGELGVEVHPMQLDGDQGARFWLPSCFTTWNGGSLVLPDEDAAAIYQTEQADGQAIVLGRLYNPVGLDQIPLTYGNRYEFRVRLMDATGGGPEDGDEAVHEAPAPVSLLHFKRFVPPEPLRIEDVPQLPADPLDSFFAGDELVVRRPLLGYPSVVFTDKYDDPVPLLAAAAEAAKGSDSFGIADPDVLQVEVAVEVRTLKMDNRLSLSGREPFILLYTTRRAFPAAFDEPLSIPLEFRDANVLRFGDPADLGDLGVSEADLANLDQLVLPTGREIRLTLRGVGDGDGNYYGTAESHIGKPLQIKVRRETSDETDLLADLGAASQIRGMYFQPDPPRPNDGRLVAQLIRRGGHRTPAIVQRLAGQLGLDHKGLTLVGRRGQRVVFGCSRRIRHTLAPDHSSLTLASKDELLNHWIVALTLEVDRDWTWDVLEEVSFEVFRSRKFRSDPDVDDNQGAPVGDLEMKSTAPINALAQPDRGSTLLVYLDAVEPKSDKPRPDNPQEKAFPDIIDLVYHLEPRFRHAPDATDALSELEIALPVTNPPSQVPRIVSAGIALSQYQRHEDYGETEPRERYLWLEFAEPVADPNDTLFVRFLGYAPDPLLSDNRFETLVPPDEPALNLDPELLRVISPAQADDGAGLSAMVPLEPATDSKRHFLVPIPAGLHSESDEMFGFFTYELRVGHSEIWSTAQGRFGRPLRSTGVQHPAPTLFCTCHRDQVELRVHAPHAMAVLNGKNITADPPRTEIWALLYAQVRQADGKDSRNILLEDRRLELIPRKMETLITPEGDVVLAKGNENAPAQSTTQWTDGEIDDLLDGLGLPRGSSLSVLCVELMPHLGSFQQRTAGRPAGAAGDVGASSFLADLGAVRGNVAAATAATSTAPPPPLLRPLSHHLGHFRLLRTSKLTRVPDVC